MRILVTNDDGIFSEGIYQLAKAFMSIGEVIVVAPNKEQSATGHSITLHRPLRVSKVKFFDTPIEAHAIDGTPVDCVKVAVEAILKDRRPDLVVSGINNGPNLGTDVIYSGTVSAAVEAAILEIPSIAVSMASTKIDTFQDAAEFTCRITKSIHQLTRSKVGIININYPTCRKESISGVKVTTLGVRRYENSLIERKDPRGDSYYWISGKAMELQQSEDSDVIAVRNNYISITPIHFDLTHFKDYDDLKKIKFEA
ncbi:5'/3'-nucleotidase SurE [Alkaliphilus peptidifermentans]|uniref:5'-nucleotidase SurE n=1 Tax=Alkaliphilus peptidifermentans DSM 18978 TaxID=1120976 RepID=A0A1G5KLF0_9FIRM|nr:5'/3'-nucleotidase SurE [Alkaliphilus peptidifermentans]SCZ01416.1 5'-nucleotidase /3'-nucleotidase /exopolyphosphatase [Alkaliphilus peptidifermentans DSM 18978]